jgi:HEAT repeat protein
MRSFFEVGAGQNREIGILWNPALLTIICHPKSLSLIEERRGMSTSAMGDGPAGSVSSEVESKKPRLLKSGLRALMMVVVCCAAAFVVWRAAWDSRHPALAAARGLHSGTPSQRLAAIREVSDHASDDSAETIAPLAGALDDSDAGVRAAAAQALGLMASYSAKSAPHAEEVRAAVSKLLETLKDRDATVRAAAASALRILAGSSSSGTTRAKGKGKGKAKGKAKESDGGAGTPTSVVNQAVVAASLLDMLTDPDDEARHAAIFALGTVGTAAFDDPPQSLFTAIEDQSPANRAAAIGTLAGFARGLDPLIPIVLRHLKDDQPALAEASMSALVKIRPAALTKAAAKDLILGLSSPNRDVRLRMVSLLGGSSPDPAIAVPALISVLREPLDSDMQGVGDRRMVVIYEGPAHSAARALARVARSTPAEGTAIAALTEAVKKGPAQRRVSAAKALGDFGPAAVDAVGALITMMEQDITAKSDTADGEAAAEALAQIAPGTPAAGKTVTALIAALKADGISTREAAIHALEPFGAAASAALPLLREIEQNDKVPNARKSAKSVLAALEGGSK